MRDIYSTHDNFKKYEEIASELVVEGNVDKPDITVFIPTYRRSETLGQTIESAVNQAGNINYEIVIVNNDPNTKLEITSDFIKRFDSDRIYYYVNRTNIGMIGNWNRGTELSRGRYITMIHDDDVLSPYCLSSIMTAIEEKNPEIIGVDAIDFNSECMPKFLAPEKLYYRHVSKKSFFFGKYVSIVGLTIKRDLLFEIGGYNEEYYPNSDTVFIYQSLLRSSVINIEYPLAGYRHGINTTLSGDTLINIITTMHKIRENIAKYEHFAKIWIDIFGKEYLCAYIQSAERYWNFDVDKNKIYSMCGIHERDISKIKFRLMKIILKFIQKGF